MGRADPDPDWLRLGVRLRARRTQLAIRREDVTRSLRLSPERLGAVERGAIAISAVQLQRLAKVLQAPIDTFLPPHWDAAVRLEPSVCEVLARTEEGVALADAFKRLQTPRLRRHLVGLAEELVAQEAQLHR